jgi:hypothetical protein
MEDSEMPRPAFQRRPLVWRKSMLSEAGNCVEVAFRGESVLIRHSQDPSGPTLSFTHTEWLAFLAGARGGEFDLP